MPSRVTQAEWSQLRHQTKTNPSLLGINGHMSRRQQTVPMLRNHQRAAAVVEDDSDGGSFIDNSSTTSPTLVSTSHKKAMVN